MGFFSISSAFGDNTNVYVLGYPRSGTHWIRCCLKKILSDVDKNRVALPSDNFFDYLGLKYQAGQHLIHFGHSPIVLGLDEVDQTQNYLIVIVRNYRECIMRHHGNQDYKVLEYLRMEQTIFAQRHLASMGRAPNL